MTLHQLRILVVIAKTLNVTKAASGLHISQPSISQQLKMLEEEYGLELYKSNGRGIKLTEKGQFFVSHAKLILEQVDELNAHLDASPRAAKHKPLVVAGSQGLSEIFLPSMVAVFQKRYPQVDVALQTGHTQAIEVKILEGETDIALMRYPSKSPLIISEPYRQERVVSFVSAKHPLARKGKITLSDLELIPLIIRGGNTSPTRVEERLKKLENQGVKPNIFMRCELPKAVKIAVGKKIGLGFLCWELVKSDVRNGIFKTIQIPDLNLSHMTYILFRRDKPLSASARDFLTLLYQRRHRSQSPKRSVPTAENLSHLKGDLQLPSHPGIKFTGT